MAAWRGGWSAFVLAALAVGAPADARAIDFQLFADRDTACAFIAAAQAEDVAMVEIWLTILQRDAANSWTLVRDDLQRLDGEARTIEQAIAAIDAQVTGSHAWLRTLRSRIRALEPLPESAALLEERNALQREMRATSVELIEMSFNLRDAKARLATIRAAIAGHRDTAAVVDAAEATVSRDGAAIHECARSRRASLIAVAPGIGARR
ncbi:MAG: hypothetical protein AB7O88_11815 [Reyranellaceae bacterium]